MRKKLKLTRIAEQITGTEAKEVTTNYTYWVRRSFKLPSTYPQKFLDKLAFYFFIVTSYVFMITPSINRLGIIYIPFCYLWDERLTVSCLVHEINHYKFPELSEQEIRIISKQEMGAWKKSLMR